MTTVEEVTGFPEMLGGRVKTLHPRVHAGILARRELEEDLAALAEHGIEPFDLVCVNLYPFELAVDRPELDEEGLIEMIDVGGPALLRAAAKNFASVRRGLSCRRTTSRCSPSCGPGRVRRRPSCAGGSPRSRSRGRRPTTPRSRAGSSGATSFPETFVPSFDRVRELAYGENPHQSAAYYAERGARTHLLSFVEQLQGKPLSFNNLNDLSAARLLAAELDGPRA